MRSKCWVDIQKPPRERRCIYKAIWLYISSFRCFWISNKLSQLFIKFLVYHILVWVYKCITIYRWKKKCDQIYHILFADYYNDALFFVWFSKSISILQIDLLEWLKANLKWCIKKKNVSHNYQYNIWRVFTLTIW